MAASSSQVGSTFYSEFASFLAFAQYFWSTETTTFGSTSYLATRSEVQDNQASTDEVTTSESSFTH